MTPPIPAGPDALDVKAAAISRPEERTLHTIFQHPLPHNLAWRDVTALMATIGSVDDQKNGDVLLRLEGEHLSMSRPHDKDLSTDDVVALRHFLMRAGWSAAGLVEPASPPVAPGVVVVIDHSGAEVHSVASDADAKPHSTHVMRRIEREAPDRDRDETFPADVQFFETVSRAIAAVGRIVVIGHGKGQSREADHLTAYLSNHHPDVHARIVREIVADLPSLTTPELLALGRHALG